MECPELAQPVLIHLDAVQGRTSGELCQLPEALVLRDSGFSFGKWDLTLGKIAMKTKWRDA